MADNENDYKVGRGRPPKQTRFQKGQSGNPSGRPKTWPDAKTILENRLFEEMPIKGKREKRLALDLLITQLRNKALTGCKELTMLLRQLIQTFGLPNPPPPQEDTSNWTAKDSAILEDYCRRAGTRNDAERSDVPVEDDGDGE